MDQHTTNWELIEGAARGSRDAQELLAKRYAAPIRAYIAARWRSDPFGHSVMDATQQVFLELYRPGGVLEKSGRERGAAFRGLLYGVSRNVARRVEEGRRRKGHRPIDDLPEPVADGSGDGELKRSFERAWARSRIDAALAQLDRGDGEAREQVRLLRARFFEGRPIRVLAHEWEVPRASLHRRYARARESFRKALFGVVAPDCPGAEPAEVEEECRALMALLSGA